MFPPPPPPPGLAPRLSAPAKMGKMPIRTSLSLRASVVQRKDVKYILQELQELFIRTILEGARARLHSSRKSLPGKGQYKKILFFIAQFSVCLFTPGTFMTFRTLFYLANLSIVAAYLQYRNIFWRKFICGKSASGMLINPPITLTFTRQKVE
jgi:hypothetical protein